MSYPTMNEALDRLDAIDPDRASDEVIADIIADYLLWSKPPYCLYIHHDVRVSTQRKIERMRKFFPDIPVHSIVPRVPYDWARKNIVGISTRDRARARQWAIDAMLAGYAVFHGHGPKGRGGGWGRGSLAEVRERERDYLSRRGRREKVA